MSRMSWKNLKRSQIEWKALSGFWERRTGILTEIIQGQNLELADVHERLRKETERTQRLKAVLVEIASCEPFDHVSGDVVHIARTALERDCEVLP